MLKEALQYILDGMRPETQDLCGRAYVITPSGAQEVIETPIVPATLQLHSLDSIVKMIRTEATRPSRRGRFSPPAVSIALTAVPRSGLHRFSTTRSFSNAQ